MNRKLIITGFIIFFPKFPYFIFPIIVDINVPSSNNIIGVFIGNNNDNNIPVIMLYVGFIAK